jgi:hypothetical protein
MRLAIVMEEFLLLALAVIYLVIPCGNAQADQRHEKSDGAGASKWKPALPAFSKLRATRA